MSHIFYYLNDATTHSVEADLSTVFKQFEKSKLHEFSIDDQTTSNSIETVVCYSEQHLYIFLSSKQSSLENRDRAYQNGDGFHFVLANPEVANENMTTDEFHVIGISPLADNWRKHFIWYQNVDHKGTPLLDTEVKHEVTDEHIYFMVKIPWHEITPLKPFLYKEYGFNISYVEAVPKGKNIYMFVNDNKIQSEQSLRAFKQYQFETPTSGCKIEYSVSLKKHVSIDQELPLTFAFNSPKQTQLHVTVSTDQNKKISYTTELNKGLNQLEIKLEPSFLIEGMNTITLSVSDQDGFDQTETCSVFKYNNSVFTQLKETINELNDLSTTSFMKESIYSLRLYHQTIFKRYKTLRDYESFKPIHNEITHIKNKLERVKSGYHLFTPSLNRLGFMSDLDRTLQPYTLYIPTHINNEKLKLIVYLHGSGSDDTSLKNATQLLRFAEEEHYIVLAPYARGTSHFYCTEESYLDVIEITKKISSLYKIDDITLCGFSMGGYGVYHVYNQAPSLYNRLISISGHCSIGRYFGGIDYNQEEHIHTLSDIPILIFHGTEDRNCKFRDVKPFFDQLQSINPNCQVHITEGLGHSGLTDNWYQNLSDWMHKL
ncbi:dienelactone hydrolase family protein [Haloplasma contractile]|uniref:Phospholipase-Carboxylesterase protein n=1 Tax=Haloplasma contractile SSD-17B TaxID=1033810 RepID=F7PUE8_9MOLU|nr:dienelactone hydrolase family protein [Haloplasma contractile]ERJ11779.1 Phospholipase-Carboxylesterase protein [Haloplasma contractile SSD-17B]